LGLESQPDIPGQWLMVDKNVYEWRSPRRWELVVFRGPTGMAYVKRVVGLPGDTVQIKDGDVFINGEVAPRSPSICRQMSYVLYDGRFDSRKHWQLDGPVVNEKGTIQFTAGATQRAAATFALDRDQNDATDWNIYNGARVNRIENVDDLRLRFQVEATAGAPSLWLECGSDGSEFALPNQILEVDQLSFDRWKPQMESTSVIEKMSSSLKQIAPFRMSGPLRIPFTVGIRGGSARISDVTVFRDTHYQSVGRHAIKTAIRLGSDEFFVLGDNSAVSDDSRMWPEPGVKRAAIIGRPLR
jgi:signal peptidase I